jgi:hypothetical protein
MTSGFRPETLVIAGNLQLFPVSRDEWLKIATV